MALLTNTAESGLADGTVVSTSNSAFPDAFTSVTNTQITYLAAAAQSGSLGFRHTATSGVKNWIGWTGVAGAASSYALRFYLRFAALPANAQYIAKALSSTGGTGLVAVRLGSTGAVSLDSDPGAATFGPTTATLAVNTWYRVELGVTAASTTTGTATLRVYSGDSMTVVASLDLTNVNLGAAVAAGTCRFGRYDAPSTTSACTFDFDNLAFQTGSATLIGPATNAAPTVVPVSQSNVEPWSTVTMTATETDSDGTVVSRVWTQTGGPTITLTGATTTAPTFSAPATIAGTIVTLGVTVTDNVGATGSGTATVGVLPVTERAVIGGVEVPLQIRQT